MAEQNVLNISLKEYKKSIDDLRASLLNLEKGSEEYNATVEEIAEKQNKLNEVMNAGKTAYDSTTNSLNGMKEKLKELKSEFGNMEVGTEQWQKAQDEIGELNGKIGEVEQGMGIFSRNVGNYSSAFNTAINSMGGSVGNLIPTIAGLKNGFIALQRVPIVALIAAIAMALQQLISAFKSSQENVDGLNRAMAPISAVMGKVQRVFEELAGAIIKVIEPLMRIIGKFYELAVQSPIVQAQIKLLTAVFEGLGWVLDKVADFVDWLVGGFNKLVDAMAGAGVGFAKDMQNARKEMEELEAAEKRRVETEIELHSLIVENIKKRAELENDIAELEATMADKEHKTIAERRAALNEWKKKQNELLSLQQAELEKQQIIAEIAYNKAGSTWEEAKALAEVNAQLEKVKGKRAEIDRSYNQTSSRLAKEEKSQANEALRKKQEAEKKKQDAAKKTMQAEIEYIESQLKYVAKGTQEEYDLRKQLADKRMELAKFTAQTEIENADALAKKLRAIRSEYLAELRGLYKTMADISDDYYVAALKQQINSLKASKEYYKHRENYERQYYNARTALLSEEITREHTQLQTAAMMQSNDFIAFLSKDTEAMARLINSLPFKQYLQDIGVEFKQFYKEAFSEKDLAKRLENMRTYVEGFLQKGIIRTQDMNAVEQAAQFGLNPQAVKDASGEIQYYVIDLAYFVQDTWQKFWRSLDDEGKKGLMGVQKSIYEADNAYVEGMEEIVKNAAETDWGMFAKENALAISTANRDIVKSSQQYADEMVRIQQESVDKMRELMNQYIEIGSDPTWQKNLIDAEARLTELKRTQTQTRVENMRWEAEQQRMFGDEWKQVLEEGIQVEIEKGEIVNAKVDENLKVRAGLFSSAFGKAHSLTEEYLERESALYDLQHLTWDKNAETYEQFLERKRQATERYVKAAQKIYQRDAKNMNAFASSVGSMLQTVADAWEDKIDRDKKNEEVDKKKLKDEWKRMKALQIAAATVTTISGAVAAYMNDVKTYQPAWVGMAIGAVDAAATLVAGYAQIQTIRNQEFDAENPDTTGGGAPQQTVTVAGATPLLDEATDLNSLQDLPMANGSGEQGDSRVYILQTDISESDRQVEVRQNSTTF